MHILSHQASWGLELGHNPLERGCGSPSLSSSPSLHPACSLLWELLHSSHPLGDPLSLPICSFLGLSTDSGCLSSASPSQVSHLSCHICLLLSAILREQNLANPGSLSLTDQSQLPLIHAHSCVQNGADGARQDAPPTEAEVWGGCLRREGGVGQPPHNMLYVTLSLLQVSLCN